jgi:hypothetical protein
MKNTYLATLATVISICLFTNNTFAQGAYVQVNTGLAFPSGAQNLDYFDFSNFESNSSGLNYISTREQVPVSLGKGLNIGGAFGYMFNEHFGAELGLSYLIGGKSVAISSDTDPFGNYTDEYTFSSKMLRIIPSLVIAAGGEKINPYAKFGMVIGSGTVLLENNYKSDGDVYIAKLELSGGMAMGLSSSIGALYNLSDNMSLFGELNMINMSYAPTKGELIEVTDNGIDELPYMTTNEKEIEFVDSYTYNSANPTSDSQPDKELKQYLPFGSFGINVGLKISF